MTGLAYVTIPTLAVILGVPVATIVCWRAGQHLATGLAGWLIRRATDADSALA